MKFCRTVTRLIKEQQLQRNFENRLTLATFLFHFRVSNLAKGESGFKSLNSTLRFYVLDAGSPSGFQRSSQQFQPKRVSFSSQLYFLISNFVLLKVKDYLVFIYKGLKFISLS